MAVGGSTQTKTVAERDGGLGHCEMLLYALQTSLMNDQELINPSLYPKLIRESARIQVSGGGGVPSAGGGSYQQEAPVGSSSSSSRWRRGRQRWPIYRWGEESSAGRAPGERERRKLRTRTRRPDGPDTWTSTNSEPLVLEPQKWV